MIGALALVLFTQLLSVGKYHEQYHGGGMK